MLTRILREAKNCLTILHKPPDFGNCTNPDRFEQDQPGFGREPNEQPIKFTGYINIDEKNDDIDLA